MLPLGAIYISYMGISIKPVSSTPFVVFEKSGDFLNKMYPASPKKTYTHFKIETK